MNSRRQRKRLFHLVDECAADDLGAQVNLSPLVDMVFLLLIFFMVTNTVRNKANSKALQEVPVTLPAVSPMTPNTANLAPTVVRLIITAQGEVQVDNAPAILEPTTLATHLRRAYDTTALKVLICTHRDAPAGVAVEVLQQCRLAGVAAVAFQSQVRNP